MVLQTRGRVGRRQLFKMKERAFVRTNARSCYDVLSAKLLFMNATHNLRICFMILFLLCISRKVICGRRMKAKYPVIVYQKLAHLRHKIRF